jgi:3-phenylpropionate/cinnamic acid dioxygenase small subunit
VAGALERRTTILVGPTKAAEPQSRRDSETGYPHLVVAETEDGYGAAETTLGMEGAPERKALRDRAIALEMLALLEATQPSGMLMMETLADLEMAGAFERRTTILVGSMKAEEPQSRRDNEIGHLRLVVVETEDGHGAAETNPVVVGMTGWRRQGRYCVDGQKD